MLEKVFFLLPAGVAGKGFVEEMARLINSWTYKSDLETKELKVLMISSGLLLQKTSLNSSYLFVQGGKRLKSLEGTTQGDLAAMTIYALGITPLLTWLSNLSKEKTEKFPLRQLAFAEDLNDAGSLENLKKWWDLLEQEGGKFGYYVKASKLHIILKEKYQNRYFKEAR